MLVVSAVASDRVNAQSTEKAGENPSTPSTAATASESGGRLRLPFRGGPLVTGTNVWAGSAFSIRTASNNERFDGAAFQMAGIQFTRSLFQAGGIQFSWMVEVLPAIVARVGAPENRLPPDIRNNREWADPKRIERYRLHDAYGVGLAPLGAELSRPVVSKLSAVFNVTAGGAWFNAVVPYGKATQANFTVSPTLALEWQISRRYAISSGYNLHHLSNASFGAANPGLNSHLIFVRLAKARFPNR